MKSSMFSMILFMYSSLALAQALDHQVIGSSGSTYVVNGLHLDWTLGELAVTTIEGNGSMISQGMHQPSYLVTAIDILPEDIGHMEIFPNPTAGKETIKISLEKPGDFSISVYNVEGKSFWQKEYSTKNVEEVLDLSPLPDGSYFISVKSKTNLFHQTYQVVKSH